MCAGDAGMDRMRLVHDGAAMIWLQDEPSCVREDVGDRTDVTDVGAGVHDGCDDVTEGDSYVPRPEPALGDSGAEKGDPDAWCGCAERERGAMERRIAALERRVAAVEAGSDRAEERDV
jgi:hypothetical protein